MFRLKFILCLALFLAPTMVQAQSSFEDDALNIPLMTGLYGAGLQACDLDLPESFLTQIELANTGRYDVFVEVAHDNGSWKLLYWLSQNEQTLKLDQIKIQWEILQKCADESLNLARSSNLRRLLDDLGLKSKRVFVRSKPSDTPYVKIYVEQNPWVKPVQNNRRDIVCLEEDVVTLSGKIQELKNVQEDTGKVVPTSESKFALAVMAGATTTQNMICPEVSGTLFYKDAVMLRANGFYGLGLTKERSIYNQLESTYDKGWGLGFGFRPKFLGPIWAYVGVHAQSNTLASSGLAGDITSWFKGGEFGLMLIADHFQVSATYLYGDVKEYDVIMTNDDDFRLSVNIGNTWR